MLLAACDKFYILLKLYAIEFVLCNDIVLFVSVGVL